MKALCVSFESPNRTYGGGWGIIQSLVSVCSNAEIDYVGPEFEQKEYPQIRANRCFFLQNNNGVITKAWNILRGVTARYYQEWKRVASVLKASDYDLVFIDFSYNDFIVKWAQEHGLKTVVRVHNIEQDMAANLLRVKKIDKYWLRALLNGWLIKRREAQMMHACDRLIFLTQTDLSRACELYGEEHIREKSVVVPVCMERNSGIHCDAPIKGKYILATGSLNYGPNAKGIKWFAENVWKDIQERNLLNDMKFVIAGRMPDAEMKRLGKRIPNCIVVDSPEEIAPYFLHASLYVAPIFSGAGMKVKVAEALSYGLSVIGAHHALIGYEEAEGFCVEANTADEFEREICNHFKRHQGDESAACREMYDRVYSLERSARDFSKVLKEMKQNEE